MDKVLRTFTAGRGSVKVGAIIDASQFRNLGRLRRRGYLVEVGDAEATPIDEVYVEKSSPESVEDAPAEVVSIEAATEDAGPGRDPLDEVADAPVSSPVARPDGRVLIIGGPKTGKTTLAAAMGGGRSTDEVIEDLDWSEASAEIATWFDDPGPWLIEGVAIPRALRKWQESHPDEPAPVDHVIYLTQVYQDLEPEAAAMAKGVETVFEEILPWLLESVEITEIAHEGVKTNASTDEPHVANEDVDTKVMTFDEALAELKIDPVSVNTKSKLSKTRKDNLVAIARLMGKRLAPDEMNVGEIVALILSE